MTTDEITMWRFIVSAAASTIVVMLPLSVVMPWTVLLLVKVLSVLLWDATLETFTLPVSLDYKHFLLMLGLMEDRQMIEMVASD